jgi:hypothetical protein
MIERIRQAVGNFLDTIHWRANKWTPQIRAKVQPYASCFGHSVAWFLQSLGVQVTPDDVMIEVNGPQWQAEAARIVGKRTADQYRGKINQLWQVMVAYCNTKLVEKRLSARAIFAAGIDDARIRQALRHAPVICAIRPRYRGRILGHVVLIVGHVSGKWIVDDPFGDFRAGYPSHVTGGDDIKISCDDFRKLSGQYYIYATR